MVRRISTAVLTLTGRAFLCTPRYLFLALLLTFVSGIAQADLFVGSNGTSTVDRYNGTTGTFVNTLASVGLPCGIVIGPDGTLYVSDNGTNLIDEYNINTGSLLGTINTRTQPSGLAFGPGNMLYVASYASHTISKVDLTNDTSTLFASLNEANGIVVASTGDVYATSFGGGTLSHYNSAGTLLGSVGLGSRGYGVTIGKDGYLYASGDNINGYIDRIDPTTLASSVFTAPGNGGLSYAAGITVGADGNLYVSSFNTNEVKEYDGTTGAFISNFVTAGCGGLNEPVYLAFAPSAGVPEISSVTILALGMVCVGIVMRRRNVRTLVLPIRRQYRC